MLRAIAQTFFKIRVIFGAIRAGIKGIAIVLGAWIFLAPPSTIETERLALSADATAQDEVLRAHRVSKLLVLIDSDRIYEFAAEYSESGATASDLRLNVILAADGRSLAAVQPETDLPQTGAKFVSARTN